MGFPDRSRLGRARLAIESLEDRLTPAGLAEFALPELAAAVPAGDRVNVVMTATSTSAADAAALRAAPFAADVTALGFGIYSVTLTPGSDLGGAVAYYGTLAGVQSAAPDEVFSVQATPNDPRYTNGSLYGLNKIGAPAAWDTTTGNKNFVVAVIDSGVDYRHQDLYLNTFLNQREIPASIRANLTDVDADGLITFRDLNNAVNIGTGKARDLNANGYIDGDDLLRPLASGGWADGIDGNGTAGSTNTRIDDLVGWDFANNDNNPFDDNNHGTHVAGTIGGIGNNGVGVAGVNWAVQIMGLKFLSASGSGATSGAVSALNYAVDMGVKVSNNSWGGGGFSSTLDAAIARARTFGHIFVAAAGNSNTNNDATPNYPSNYNYDNVVAVAATDSSDVRASFSSYGATTVDLAAPGVGIWSTTPNNGYASFNGTSMATPHVAGAIALYWGANPTLTYQQVISKLYSSVDKVSGLTGVVATGGRLNVAKMFATSPAPFVSGPKVVSAVYGATATSFDNVLVTFDKAVLASTFTTADVTAFTGPTGALAVTGVAAVNPQSNGTATQFRLTFAPQTAAGNYALTFGSDITDAAGNRMNQNGDTVNGGAGDQFTATGSISGTVARTFTTGAISVSLPDLRTTNVSMSVADDLRVADLDVVVSLTHTWVGDLVITLTSPTVNGVAGKTVTLFNRRGGSGDNLTGTRFNDEATVAIANGRAPFSGSFRPEGLLSAFDGVSTKGVWTLTVRDAASGDVGRLTNWQLVVTGATGGSGRSTALGFLADEPLAPAADVTPMSAAPAVDTSAPAAPVPAGFASAPTAADADAAPAAAVGGPMMSWLGSSDEEDGEYTVRSSESESSYFAGEAETAFGALLGGERAADATGAALEVVYLAPTSDDVSDALGALFGDA